MNTRLKNILLVVGIVTVVFALGTILYLGYFGEYQKSYWDTYFDAKRKKINLADDEHIDSLLNEIQKRDSIIEFKNAMLENSDAVRDSIIDAIKTDYDNVLRKKDSMITVITKDRDLLMDAIKHQNTMIQNLSK